MKFSDISAADWPGLRPYLDTCVLPLTGLCGREEPGQVTVELERLRDVLEWVELPFHGRIVTYPAIQYVLEEGMEELVNGICRKLKEGGFRYVLGLTASSRFEREMYEADLFFSPYRGTAADLKNELQALWQRV